MSVINQVLNQLEQRGARTAPEQTLVRAVPNSKRKYTLPLLLFGLVLVAGLAAWQWVQQRKSSITVVSIAPKAGDTLHSDDTVKPALPQQPATAQIPQSASTSPKQPSGASAANPSPMLSPPLQLSFELSSVPLPSAERQGPVQAAKDKKGVAEIRDRPLESAKKKPAKTTAPNPTVAVETPMKQVSPAQQADAEFRKAVALMQQGRTADSLAGYEAALRLDPGHDSARQALVALLVEEKRGADAERVLQERLNSKPDHTGFAMLLARLQVERGGVDEALATLENSLPYAGTQADYHAFLAALLQRQNRNEEAIKHYQIVTQLAPGNGIWLMGYGISLQAVQRNADAKEAFKKALDTKTLSPDLQEFVQQKLKEL